MELGLFQYVELKCMQSFMQIMEFIQCIESQASSEFQVNC